MRRRWRYSQPGKRRDVRSDGVRIAVGALCLAALLAGCKPKIPATQIAATVNGQDVTVQELDAETSAANLPATVDKTVAQRAMLQRIIQRKLLAAAAADEALDKTADFIIAKRRADETMAAQAFADKQLASVPMPTAADIDKFMADHENMFRKREQLSLDQVRFAMPKDITTLTPLQGDHSLDAVAAHLTRMGISFERKTVGLDTGRAPTQLVEAIQSRPRSDPFVIPDGGMVTINVVTARRPIGIDPQQARVGAVGAWRQHKFEEILTQRVANLRNHATITYQDGFAPPPAKAPSSPPGTIAGPAASQP